MDLDEVLAALRASADASRLPGMARVGIETTNALGVPVPAIRKIAKRAGMDHRLAKELWTTEIHEARMVAGLVADPTALSFGAMAAWARDLYSWDLTDLLADTYVGTAHMDKAIRTWHRATHGFTARCAFSMVARLAVGHPDEPDETYLAYLPLIRDAATDDRNEVKKAVNWALRQIGKAPARSTPPPSQRPERCSSSTIEPPDGSPATRSASSGARRPSHGSRADGRRTSRAISRCC